MGRKAFVNKYMLVNSTVRKPKGEGEGEGECSREKLDHSFISMV